MSTRISRRRVDGPAGSHIWIWWLTPDSPLTANERSALDLAGRRGELRLSAISMWEAQVLHAKRRLELPMRFMDWIALGTDPRSVALLPLDRDVIAALDTLASSFHGDPADRLIVATARAHALPLATREAAIRRARVVKLWKP